MNESKEMEKEQFEKRPYQEAIIDVCINKNSIVFLPTGAGKSYIAIQVIKHFSGALEKKYSDGGKRSVFLVNTVCLAKQQAESIANMLPFKVSVLCGEVGVDFWNLADWSKVLDENEILVATAQVVLDAIKHSYFNLEQINVIVFDECHHGRKEEIVLDDSNKISNEISPTGKDHPYHEIMKQINSAHDVRIIGLSGMLIGNDNKIKSATVEEELRRLESVFLSTIITVNNLDDYKNVLLCSTNAMERLLKFSKPNTLQSINEVSKILENLQKMLSTVKLDNYITIDPKSLRETTPRKVKDLILLFKDFHYQANEMGPYGGYLSLLSTMIQFELIKRWCDTDAYREIVKVCITTTERCINKMELEIGLSRSDASSILKNSSDKVKKLFCVLMQKFNDPNREKNLQCLVFVERRSTAKALYHALKAYATANPNFPIIPDFMVGINNEMPESIEAILNHNYNSIALEKFKNNETNLIVASSVLEEGIDLQMCNLVVMYDTPKVYRSYVQARGRARVDNSHYIVLVDSETVDKFQKKVLIWRDVDRELKKQLLLKTIDRDAPSEEDIQKERMDCWEPFVTPISKSVLNNCNAVSLVNHYAMKMPADCFTNVNVFWRRIDLEDGRVAAALQLPAQSVIKEEVIGDPQPNVKLAKQHAAFKACIKLFEHGELNDNLVPVDDKQKIELFTDDYFSHWEDYKSDKKSAGTRNHRRYHNIKTPDVLQNSDPKINATSFLYRIIVRPKFDAAQYSIKIFRELLENQKEFGILTSKRIPRLSKMTLFQSFGEIEVEISAVPVPVKIKSSEELKLLQNFHVAIFRDVLMTWENFLVLDKTSYLIVPLTVDTEIDWRLVTDFQSVQHPRRLTYDEIKETDFSRNAYFHKVMNPVYRCTDQNYVIIDVPEHMTPLSPFPDENYSSYKDYVETRFSTNIFRDDQPMIEVKGISNNLNLFFPGTGASGKQRKHEKQNLTEHYIPEVCHNYKFPADFWLKATLLPSVCHRMTYLLLAEELRMWLIDEGIDRGMGQQIYQLDVDYGNYDEREIVLRDIERDEENCFNYAHFQELMKKTAQEKSASGSTSDEAQHTKALLLWDRSKLPLDIDRNWLTVSEVDINYYCDFLNLNRNKKSPTSMARLQQLNGSPTRHDRLLMDSNDRSDISIIHLQGIVESVQQKNLIKVLTTSNAGDVFDMERYEVLGDGFLKFIASLYLYKKHDDWHEGYLTSLKGRLVSNRNLFYIGNNFGLSSMIKSSKYDTKESLPASTRLPPNAQKILEEDKTLLTKLLNISEPLRQEDIISGHMDTMVLEPSRNEPSFGITQDPFDDDNDEQVEKSMLTYIKQHFVGDKIIADAVEAFLGVVVQSLGIQAGLKMCQKLKILPDEESLGSLLTEKIPPRKVINSVNASHQRIINSQELEKIIGYKFQDPTYLVQALTHASFPLKTLGSYQQLEFLGDAVLDFLITSYITEQCKSMDPGKLTDLRSALVNNVTLACVVVRNGIHKFLRAQNLLLAEAIKKFVDYQSSQDHKVVLDQIILLETENDTQSAESVDVPKVIGDIFESIVGAVFLDSCMDLSATWKVIYGLLKDELHAFMENVPIQIVRQLFEFEKGKAEPKFFKVEEIDEESVGVPLEITVRGEKKMFLGIGKNRSVAKKCAAKLALKCLMNSLKTGQ